MAYYGGRIDLQCRVALVQETVEKAGNPKNVLLTCGQVSSPNVT